jgi:hypothetical protein
MLFILDCSLVALKTRDHVDATERCGQFEVDNSRLQYGYASLLDAKMDLAGE